MAGAWEVTGNHYLAMPFLALQDGSIHGLNVVHRGLNSMLSWGAERIAHTEGEALLRSRFIINGEAQDAKGLAWDRLDRWMPRYRARVGDIGITCTMAAPGGFEPIVRGGLVWLELENTSGSPVELNVRFEGCWRWSLATIATTRTLPSPNRVVRGERLPGLALELGEFMRGAALGLSAGAEAHYSTSLDGASWTTPVAGDERTARNGDPIRFRIDRPIRLKGGRRTQVPLFIGVATERDAALATASWMEGIGAAELVRLGRLELARIGRAADGAVRDIVGRNAAFHYYTAVARAVDDDRAYPMRSRSPEHGPCAAVSERALLAWSLPALAQTDAWLARDVLLRALEQYSDRPGHPHRYLNGSVLVPGFALGQLCDYVLGIEQYVEITKDEDVLEEVIVQQVLRELDEAIYSRLHPDIFLAASECYASGDRSDYPYIAFDNVLVWRTCRALPKLVRMREGDPRLRLDGGDEEVAAALWQRCTVDWDGVRVIGGSADLKGNVAIYDDPEGSLRLLPHLGFCSEDDPIWSDTMDMLHSKQYPLWHGASGHPGLSGRSRPQEASMAALCASLFGPRREQAIATLMGLDLPGGIAGQAWDPETGRIVRGPWAAAEAGFLAWALLHQKRAPKEKSAAKDKRKK
jgi:hypothetical protein